MIITNLLYTIALFIQYIVFDIAVPAIVLYPFVKEHEFGFRILFYQIAYLAYLSMMSFLLCFIGIYNCFTSWLFFVIAPISVRIFLDRASLKVKFAGLRYNLFTERTLQEDFKIRYRRRKKIIDEKAGYIWKNYIKPYYMHFLILLFLIFIIAKDLGYFHLNYYTYTCSDEPTHIYWVSNLINGNPFPAGLYPHGMHFIVAQFCSMFGMNVARAWMSFGIVSITVILFSAYLVAIRAFNNKLVGLVGIFIFLYSELYPTFSSDSWYQRLLMVMPMEFAMYAFFVMLYGLICWSKDQKTTSLIMVGLGILGTTLIHVFVTIFTFFAFVVYVIVYHNTMVEKKSLHKLMLCGIAVVVLAVLPYIVGILCGFQLEQSFSWGMSNVSVGSNYSYGSSEQIAVGYEPISEPSVSSIADRIIELSSFSDVYSLASDVMTKYMTSTGEGGFSLLICCLILLFYGLFLYIKKKNRDENRERALIYIFISVSWLIEFFVLYVGYVLDIFSLMVPSRSSEFIAMLSILMLGSCIQIIYDIFISRKNHRLLIENILTVLGLTTVLILNIKGLTKNYNDFYYAFTMEEQDLKTEEYLVENEEPGTWTIISSTNARMGIYPNGYHYEITDILRCSRDLDELYIPTGDIYVVVENNIPLYGNKAVDGSDFVETTIPASAYYANVLLSDVMPIINGEVDSDVYLSTYSRVVIMSHLYYWMEKIKEIYPSEVSVFSEDETCTVYHIKQDVYFLLNLVVDYSDLVERDLAVLEAQEQEQDSQNGGE